MKVGFRVFVLNGSGEVKDTIVVRIRRQRNGCAEQNISLKMMLEHEAIPYQASMQLVLMMQDRKWTMREMFAFKS
jgi:hypothetical protein